MHSCAHRSFHASARTETLQHPRKPKLSHESPRGKRALDWLLRVQHLVGGVNPTPLMTPIPRATTSERFLG